MTISNEWIDLASFKSGNSQALRLKKELLDAAPAFASGATLRLLSDNTGIIVASEENQTEAKSDTPMVTAMLDAAELSLTAPKIILPGSKDGQVTSVNQTIEKSKKLDNVCYDIRGPVLKEAKRLEEEGNKVLKLNIGNPAPFGFEAPDEILVDVIRNLPTAQGYSDSKGLYSARKAIMQHYQAQGIMDITVEDIYIGNGVSELIVQAMQALLNVGDEMLIPAPDYPLWTAAVSLSGGNAVHYMCDEEADWFPDIDDIRKKITPRTRGIVIINPNNPTGAVYSKELLMEIVKLAREHNLIIFSDEIYDKILYDDAQHHPIAALAPDVLTITFNGLSKTYRVAGFRQGWMVLSGPKKHAKGYIEGLEMLASMRLCANVPMQHAIQTALGGYQSISEFIQPGGRLYEQRNRAWELINDIPGVSCVKPRGALYMFPKIDAKKFNILNDQKMVLDLLLQQKVLLVQGSGFNWPNPDHVRIVTLPRVDELEMAIGKFGKFLETYRQ
ncbi:pyridoxal phosphate-dependent aminotransferase [Budvicia aquatica]|uniref:Glutamate-pyruvate aminotransferase AlaA n=1 Tax=Budvicia aquatica TaxID=82979 RepID=A0A484ZUQ7_9GAMM|nr:pyridoxal phosphate-dependent aminotransferase [Budvicia aquatica]GKX51028.1 aminotransferase [Budvicia aquatica]VFS52124.1 Aspartate aminotransferase [Budvicia aquatica]